MRFKQHTLTLPGAMIVGNPDKGDDPEHYYFVYRNSSFITDFFHEIETEYTHNSSSTRHRWAAEVVEKISRSPRPASMSRQTRSLA